jgi:hypothetical protein
VESALSVCQCITGEGCRSLIRLGRAKSAVNGLCGDKDSSAHGAGNWSAHNRDHDHRLTPFLSRKRPAGRVYGTDVFAH